MIPRDSMAICWDGETFGTPGFQSSTLATENGTQNEDVFPFFKSWKCPLLWLVYWRVITFLFR